MKNLFILNNIDMIILEDVYGYLIIALIVLIALFLILREVNCWYWKINERISLMIDQNSLLSQILHNLEKQNKEKSNTTKSTDNQNIKDKNIDTTPILIEEIATGNKQYISKHEWNNIVQNGQANKYKIIE